MENPVLLVIGASPVLHKDADNNYGSSFEVVHAYTEGAIIEYCVFSDLDIKAVLVDLFLEEEEHQGPVFSNLSVIEPIREKYPDIPIVGIYFATDAHKQMFLDSGCTTHCVSSVSDSFQIIYDEVFVKQGKGLGK